MSQSANGFRSWGILSFFGIIGVVALSFLSDKTLPYDAQTKKYVTGAFAAIGLGALVFWLASQTGGDTYGIIGAGSGIGLWICLASGVFGVLMMMGIVKLGNDGKPLLNEQPILNEKPPLSDDNKPL